MTHAVAACMRNEGPYIIEWLAYHRAIGFDRLVVATNDCTDGSDALLDTLQTHGIVTHLRNLVPEGTAPQESGMAAVFDHLHRTDALWLLHIDADEFLNIGLGDGRLADLMERAGEADVIALPWLAFGDSGHAGRPLPVLPNFTRCEGAPDPEETKFKSLFRFRNFEGADDHMPKRPLLEDPLVLAATGVQLNPGVLFADKRAKYRPADKAVKPHAAVINHYAVRGEADFLMRNDRGDGQGKQSSKYHLGSKWHGLANRNQGQNRRILRQWPATEALMTNWRALSGVAAAEAACLAWDAARRAEILTAETRQAWTKGAEA
jgi:hypothetical protein